MVPFGVQAIAFGLFEVMDLANLFLPLKVLLLVETEFGQFGQTTHCCSGVTGLPPPVAIVLAMVRSAMNAAPVPAEPMARWQKSRKRS
ncbi:hypothetical protein [Aliiruegeria lutimaris]|uniref:Uncharacterized protein n=1 Tax=Aliiruegeria lutimaris TaxID=571298 RepID=A0A1G8RXH9_9RHOB|nr:hypothetical protein [Aliiruegeria lutimaris]SDJ21669.1 hypothetical protein SAMN04488026_10148 [Aliiruegeria lutimaris]